MIDTLDIYRNIAGQSVKITSVANDEAALTSAIMSKNEVTLSLATDFIPDIHEGDYVILEGVKYRLNRDPEFTDESILHSTTYVFEAPEYTLIDKILTNKITGSTKVTLLGKLRDWVELIIWNVNKTDDNPLGVDTGWNIGAMPDTECLTLTFDGIDCRALLSELASAYGFEYYTNNQTINYVSRIENERELTFTQGCGKGLYEIEQSNIDSGDITTRLYPVGGTENVIPGEGDEEGRLVLPEKYIENFSETSRVVEKKVVFEGIHPTFTGEVENPTGENKREFVCSTIDFNVEELSVGDEARVNFLTGDLMGKSFEFKWNNDEKKVTLLYQEDELASIDPETQTKPTIPSAIKYLRGGEEFNFTGIRLGQSYKDNAITSLRDKATDWLNFHCQKRVKFTLSVDYRYMRGKGELKPGDLITVKIPERSINKLIRITSVEKNLKTGKFTCVVSNYLTEKWEDKIEGQISSMQSTINGGSNVGNVTVLEKYDDRVPSEKNVLSSVRSLFEILKNNEELKKIFLSSTVDDEAAGIITFLKGLLIGKNGSGFTSLQDGTSQLVVDRLYVKIKAVFDELEVKKKTYVGGEQILSPSGMKCIRVEELTEVYRCYFKAEEDGVEVENQFTPGTLAIAQECNIKAGVSHHASNRYYWRLVTAVGPDYIDLSKTKCDPNVENDIPAAGDDIVALGHETDITRQGAIVLSSVNEVAPSILMYQGINDFTLAGKKVLGFDFDKAIGKARMRVYGDAYIGAKDESSYFKYTDEEGVDAKGRFHIEQGSTGWKNMDGLPDEIQAAADLAQKAQDAIDGAAVGSVNLLRNSGFVGNYQSEELSAETQLSADAELYSKSLKYWSGIVTVQDDTVATSGKSVVIGSLSQSISLIKNEVYVISYQAKGTSLAVSCGNYNVTQALTADYQRYTHKLTFNGSGIFMLSGTATVCDVQLERGTIATDWKPSPFDNDKTLAEFRSIQYLADAIKNGSVDMIGGLILANILMLGNYKDGVMQKVTAGISGIYNDDDDVYTWGGGTFEQAVRAVMMFKDNPNHQPSEEELKDIAKAVFTHGGRAILNDVVLRGYIYALGGEFRGKVTIADGKIILNEDGSGRLANGNIEWDADGNPTIRGIYESKIAGYRVVIDPGSDNNSFPYITFYDSNNNVVINLVAEFGYNDTVYPKIEFRDPTNEFRYSKYGIDSMTVNEKIEGANYQTFIGAGNIYIAKNSIIEWQVKKY